MTISSSLNASVAGLTTTASQLATISDNIANSSTYGYKLATTDFNSMVTASGSAIYTAGGVQADVNRLINQSGALIATANPTRVCRPLPRSSGKSTRRAMGSGLLAKVGATERKGEGGEPANLAQK